MDFKEVAYEEGTPFDSYGPGFFRLAGEIREGDLVVAPSGIRSWGGLSDADTLTALKGEIDLILVGTGTEMAPIPADLRAALEGAGLGVELMATATACRTYNVLLGENRRLAAAVLAL